MFSKLKNQIALFFRHEPGGAKAPPGFFMSSSDPRSPDWFEKTKTQLLSWFDSEPSLEELLVNGTHSMTLHFGTSKKMTSSVFDADINMIHWLQLFAQKLSCRLDPLQPFAGGLMENQQFRWHCVLPPVATSGPQLCIRRHKFRCLYLGDFLHADDSISYGLLQNAVALGYPILICGPTGAGKTSFLHALMSNFCFEERLIVVEQLFEMPVTSSAWIRLVERSQNLEGFGAVSLKTIVSESLRLRPDRLIIGEIRGDEAKAFLDAQSTGHRGSFATIHSGSIDGAVSRLFKLAGLKQFDRIEFAHQLKNLIVVRLSPRSTSGYLEPIEIRQPDWRLFLAEDCRE